jgi:hypothetical protein
MRLNTLLGVVTAAAGLACVAHAQITTPTTTPHSAPSACDNTDVQVVVYRYTSKTCAGDESIAFYQSGLPLRESTKAFKIFTCCDDLQTVSVLDSTTSITTVVPDNQCLDGTAGSTGSSGTTTEASSVAWRGVAWRWA